MFFFTCSVSFKNYSHYVHSFPLKNIEILKLWECVVTSNFVYIHLLSYFILESYLLVFICELTTVISLVVEWDTMEPSEYPFISFVFKLNQVEILCEVELMIFHIFCHILGIRTGSSKSKPKRSGQLVRLVCFVIAFLLFCFWELIAFPRFYWTTNYGMLQILITHSLVVCITID